MTMLPKRLLTAIGTYTYVFGRLNDHCYSIRSGLHVLKFTEGVFNYILGSECYLPHAIEFRFKYDQWDTIHDWQDPTIFNANET